VKLAADIRYDAAPGAVIAMLADPAFQDEVCAATGALSHEVSVEGSPAGPALTITTTRTLPADELPDFVRRLAGDTLQVRRTDVWNPADADGGRSGRVSVEIVGTPVKLTGTLSLATDGSGSLERVDGDLTASIPLLGGKVEKAAEPPIRAAIAKEQQVGTAWLAR
jgi:hypothetical protein